jgi:4-hydroxy-2-oxoheptanedioate aldolase
MHLRTGIIRERLAANLPIHCFKSNLPTIFAPHLLGSLGMDCLWFDQEHLPTDSLTMYSLVLSSHAGDADAVVRVPHGALSDAARMLDAGADAIMYPRVRAAEEVRQLVRHLRFSPVGNRGMDAMVPSNAFASQNGEDFALHSNEHNQLIVQIETREALNEVDEIAQVEGINVLFVGIGDLARELGVKCDPQDAVLAGALRRVGEAAQRHGKAWGAPALSIEHAAELLSQGALFISHGSDSSLLKAAVTKVSSQLSALGIRYGR